MLDNNAETVDTLDLVKLVMCTLVSRVHMSFYILTKEYTVSGNQGTHDKLNQVNFSHTKCNIRMKGFDIFTRIKIRGIRYSMIRYNYNDRMLWYRLINHISP